MRLLMVRRVFAAAANCLDEMNKARKAVGYEPFNPTDSANEKVLIENKALWGAFCRGMLKVGLLQLSC